MDFTSLMNLYNSPDDYNKIKELFGSNMPDYEKIGELIAKYQGLQNDPSGAQAFLGQLAGLGLELTPEMEKFLNNAISMENTASARNWDEMMRNTSLLSTGDQLSQLGLSPNNAVNVGGMSTPSGPVAHSDFSNTGLERKQMEAQRKLQMARSMISLVRGLGMAGIGGHTMLVSKGITSSLGQKAARAFKSLGHALSSKRSVEDLQAGQVGAKTSSFSPEYQKMASDIFGI